MARHEKANAGRHQRRSQHRHTNADDRDGQHAAQKEPQKKRLDKNHRQLLRRAKIQSVGHHIRRAKHRARRIGQPCRKHQREKELDLTRKASRHIQKGIAEYDKGQKRQKKNSREDKRREKHRGIIRPRLLALSARIFHRDITSRRGIEKPHHKPCHCHDLKGHGIKSVQLDTKPPDQKGSQKERDPCRDHMRNTAAHEINPKPPSEYFFLFHCFVQVQILLAVLCLQQYCCRKSGALSQNKKKYESAQNGAPFCAPLVMEGMTFLSQIIFF